MSSDERLPEELNSFEHALSGLAPAPSRIDRDRLMFELGVQAASEQLGTSHAIRPRRWFAAEFTWAAAAVLLACTSLGLAVRLSAELRKSGSDALAVQSGDSARSELTASAADDASLVKSPEPLVPALRRKFDAQWLAVASPASRGNETLRLRPRQRSSWSEASTPVVMTDVTTERDTGNDADEPSRVHPVPQRLNNREKWQVWLDSMN